MNPKLFLSLLLVAATLAAVAGGPIHASCKLTWQVSVNCTSIHTMLRNEVAKLGNIPCVGEKCLYTMVSDTPTQMKTKHMTPVKHYVDDQTFTFEDSGTACTIDGYSTSETWYAVIDYGTNYCNMRNLATGSGIVTMAGFKETTSNSICTDYSSADCNKY